VGGGRVAIPVLSLLERAEMGVLSLTNSHWQVLIVEHRQWLSRFDEQHLVDWNNLLNNNSEAALCEAATRRLLEREGIVVEPYKRHEGNSRRPDFHCHSGEATFYVEVTCVQITTAESRSSISADPIGHSPFNVFGMIDAVVDKLSGKTTQCADLDAPALVVVGTFHTVAAMVGFKKPLVSCILTGKTNVAWDIDIDSGQHVAETHEVAEPNSSAFLRRDKTDGIGFARSPISGVLACGFGSKPGKCLGVLHPNPARPFHPALLPNIDFGEVDIDESMGRLCVHWPKREVSA
jgi:hypothetical protein